MVAISAGDLRARRGLTWGWRGEVDREMGRELRMLGSGEVGEVVECRGMSV
jgi:hypothetical protein